MRGIKEILSNDASTRLATNDSGAKTGSPVSDLVQGTASLAVLYYILFSDLYRFPERWQGRVPRDVLTAAPAFLLWIALLFFVEGTKKTVHATGGFRASIKSALRCYVPYWIICLPLTVVGYLFFNVNHGSPIYSPMFERPTFLNISRALAALTNNVHEGAWLVSCLAICAFFSSMGETAKQEKGERRGLIWLAAGVIASTVLYLLIMPFHYHKAVFRVGAVWGACCYMAGRLLGGRPVVQSALHGGPDGRSVTGRAVEAVLAPVRFIGRNWVAFWLLQFFVAWYFYNVPVSVYTAIPSMRLAYIVILVICTTLLYAAEWGWSRFVGMWRRSRLTALAILLMLAVPLLLQYAIEASVIYGSFARRAARQWPYYTLVCALAIMCVIAILRALVGRWHIAGTIAALLFTLLGVANYYTMKYHGTLLMAEDLRNFGTAANVIRGYDLSIDADCGRVLLLGGAAVLCCVLCALIDRKARTISTSGQNLAGRAICLLVAAGIGYLLYFAPKPIIDKNKNTWSWLETYADIGYISGTVESTIASSGSVIQRPADYSDERIARLVDEARADQGAASTSIAQDEDYPDIIMILNETYYDLDRYIDITADTDYMRCYHAMDNAVKGYVMTPFAAGNTNSTEFEMLTANSMTLVNTNSPFNRVDFTDQLALPNYLEQLGYATIAAHPHFAQNYMRSLRWSQMGFDRCYFLDQFTDLESYGNRGRENMGKATDSSAFRNLARFYNDMPEDKPRFAFLLTIQNHGGWDLNPPEQDLVHCTIGTDDAATVNMINEYTSCISLTDEMIGEMQRYFSKLYEDSGRRVVVCMAGDHSPSFISDLADLCKWTDESLAKRMARSTPYFIWANYPLDPEALDLVGSDDMDMTCLMPTVLKVAGVPMSYYYRQNLKLCRDIAAFTYVQSNYRDEEYEASFCDREGEIHGIEEQTPVAERLRDYYAMEYNLINRGVKREKALFDPY